MFASAAGPVAVDAAQEADYRLCTLCSGGYTWCAGNSALRAFGGAWQPVELPFAVRSIASLALLHNAMGKDPARCIFHPAPLNWKLQMQLQCEGTYFTRAVMQRFDTGKQSRMAT